MEVDYYYLLGIEEDASRKEIRAAYRRMAEVYHPDKLRELPDDRKKEGNDIMRLLNEAKSILLDPEKRRQYDSRIGAGITTEEVMIVPDSGPAAQAQRVVAVEKGSVASKMSRVLDSMKEVFQKDREFQSKIADAEEVFEAQVIEDRNDDEASEDVMVLDEVEEEDVEMKLEFTVVDRKETEKRDAENKGSKKFKILAIEGDSEDEISEDEEVDVEWD